MRIGIVFATMMEASPFLTLCSANQQKDRSDLFVSPENHTLPFWVGISGMGKVAAALLTQELILKYKTDLVINAGICGALVRGEKYRSGAVFRIDSAVEGDCDRLGRPETPVMCESGLFTTFSGARLVTNDRPVFLKNEKERLCETGDLVDMEGAAVARAAVRHKVEWAMIKGVSDLADKNGKDDIQKNLGAVSEKLAKVLIVELESLTSCI